jgi:hypothetical protein
MRVSLLALLLVPVLGLGADQPTPTKLSELKGSAPATWKSEKPSNRLRSYQFKLPAKDPQLADAELAVFPESTPKYEAKFTEWKESYIPADGTTIDQASKVSMFEVAGFKVHVLDVQGTWKFRERPRDPSSKEMLKPEYRTVWFVLIGKEETTHLRLSGPMKVVEQHLADVMTWLKSHK